MNRWIFSEHTKKNEINTIFSEQLILTQLALSSDSYSESEHTSTTFSPKLSRNPSLKQNWNMHNTIQQTIHISNAKKITKNQCKTRFSRSNTSRCERLSDTKLNTFFLSNLNTWLKKTVTNQLVCLVFTI